MRTHRRHNQLTKDPWILLTNLIHLIIDSAALKTLLKAFYEEACDVCRRNADLQALSLTDRFVLLSTAMDKITYLSGIFACAQAQPTPHRGFMSHIDTTYGLLTTHHHRWIMNLRIVRRRLNKEYADVKRHVQ